MCFLFSSVLYFHIGLSSLETVLHTGWNMTIVSRSHIRLYFHMSCTFHMFLCVCLAPSSCTFQVAPNGPHTSGPSSTASRRSSAKSSGSQPAMAPETMGIWHINKITNKCVPGTVSGSQKTCLKKMAHSDTNKGWHSCRPNHPTARILALSFLSHPVRIMIQTSESALATPRRAAPKRCRSGQGLWLGRSRDDISWRTEEKWSPESMVLLKEPPKNKKSSLQIPQVVDFPRRKSKNYLQQFQETWPANSKHAFESGFYPNENKLELTKYGSCQKQSPMSFSPVSGGWCETSGFK